MNDEHILWAGLPDPNVMFIPADIYIVPFSLLWGGFAVYWEVGVVSSLIGADELNLFSCIFPLFGIPFVLFGLYFIFGRFIYKKWRKRHTFYAVTNKRILILDDRNHSLQEINISSIPGITLSERSNGTGTIKFSNSTRSLFGFTSSYEWTNNGMEFWGNLSYAFFDIKEARKVSDIINRQRNLAATSS